MTIDEAIQDFRQLENEFEHYMCDTEDKKENLVKYQREWEYYKQLAEWLEELKEYKLKEFQCHLAREEGISIGYNKAIDDFLKEICKKYTEEERKQNFKQYCCGIKQELADLAQQLKAGDDDA